MEKKAQSEKTLLWIVLVVVVLSFAFLYMKSNSVELAPGQSLGSKTVSSDIDKTNFFCTDSDGGVDFFTPGTVTWRMSNGVVNMSDDFCIGNDGLLEWYCPGPGTEFVFCSSLGNYTCVDGACVLNQTL